MISEILHPKDKATRC